MHLAKDMSAISRGICSSKGRGSMNMCHKTRRLRLFFFFKSDLVCSPGDTPKKGQWVDRDFRPQQNVIMAPLDKVRMWVFLVVFSSFLRVNSFVG